MTGLTGDEGAGPPPGAVTAIVPAAGSGRRFGGGKLWAAIAGQPVLAWTLRALADPASGVDALVVAAPVADHDRVLAVAAAVAARIPCRCTEGGLRRQASVAAGLRLCATPWVVVHDGARPAVTPALVAAVIAAAQGTGAATAALPVTDTVAEVDRPWGPAEVGADGPRLRAVPDRGRMVAVQTPQAFRIDWLVEAHAAASACGRQADDDAALVLAQGHPVAVVAGQALNRKLTTGPDLAALADWLAGQGTGR